MLSTFLSQIVNGLVFGSLIGLIALGYTMVYGIIQLINFAHGEIFMVGAYGALFMFTYVLPIGVAAAVVPRPAAHAARGRRGIGARRGGHGAVRLPAVARLRPGSPR